MARLAMRPKTTMPTKARLGTATPLPSPSSGLRRSLHEHGSLAVASMGHLFGTNGVRGTVNGTMTPELALRLGKAVGSWLKPGQRLAIASDARQSRDMLRSAFCAGVHATGVHTVDLGVIPSPGIQLYVRDKGFGMTPRSTV